LAAWQRLLTMVEEEGVFASGEWNRKPGAGQEESACGGVQAERKMNSSVANQPQEKLLREALDAYRGDLRPAESAPTVKTELWLLLSLFLIAFVLNSLVDAHRMVLGFYALPTLYSAYKYGRRHAVLTAFASVFIVVLVTRFNPVLFSRRMLPVSEEKWFDITVWGGILVITAYAMGTLYDRSQRHLRELRESYHGILLILQHIASNDKFSRDHAYRVAICATKIAERMELGSDRVEDVRAAALLHDVEKLGISREILYKSANLTEDEVRQGGGEGRKSPPPVGRALRRVIPILLAFSDRRENEPLAPNAPLEAHILAVADLYETLTAGNSRMSPSEAIGEIAERVGAEFDPKVVDAFVSAFQYGRAQGAAVVKA